MDPKAVIESYVDEVVRRLPAHERKEMGFELRDLLNGDLAHKAEQAGRPADEAMTLALLREFGAPGEVAERYRPTGFEIVRKSESRMFAIIAFGGVLAQWALSYPVHVLSPIEGEFLIRLRDWWMTSAVHAFAWPGIMVTVAIIASWTGFRPSEAHERVAKMIAGKGETPPVRREVLDPDRVDRWAIGIGLAGLAIAAASVLFAPSLLHLMPEPARQAFALDAGFARERLPFLLAPWAGQVTVFALVLVNGRWRRTTRILDQAFNIAGGVVIAWFILSGPMLQNAEVDAFAKLILGAVTLVVVMVAVGRLRREQMRVGPNPAG